MGLNIGALGNFAGGVAKGITAYQEQAFRDKEMAMREEALGMQKKKFGWEETEETEKQKFRDIMARAFGQGAPDEVGNVTNINPARFAGGDEMSAASAAASAKVPTAIPVDDAAILAHAKTLPPEVADQITTKAKIAGDATSDPDEAQRLRTQAYRSLVAENIMPATGLPVKPPTDLDAPAATAIPTAATAAPATPASTPTPASGDKYLQQIQAGREIAQREKNGYAVKQFDEMEANYYRTAASKQSLEVGEQTKTKNSIEIAKQKREQQNLEKWDKTVDDHNERFDVIKKLQSSNSAKEVFDAIQKDVTTTIPGSKIELDEKKNVILYTAPGTKKPVELTPAQALDKVGAALLEDLGHSALRSFSSPEKMLDAINKKAEIDAKTMDADTHRMFYGPNGVYQQVHNAAANAKNTAIGDKSIKAKATETASAMVEANIVNPVTKKPYTQDEAYQYALRIQLHDPNMKAQQEWKLSTDSQTRSTADGTIVQDWDQPTNSWKTRGLPTVSENANKLGVTGVMSKDGRTGFQGKDAVYSSEREAVESFSPKAAIPINKSTSGSHSASDIYKPAAKQDEKTLRAEWADLAQRQKLVGGSPETKARSALRMREIEQTLNGVGQSNKFIKTN